MEESNRGKVITVGTTQIEISAEIQPQNSERVLIRYQNISTGGQVITVNVDSEAVDNAGIVLNPGGFHMESKDSKDFNIVTQKRITAISNLVGGSLAVYERVISV